MSKTWFITGTSRGFGRQFAESALERGDRVTATARTVGSLDDLVARFGDAVLPLELDVTDRAAAVAAVKAAHAHFGSLDIVVNNAGYGLFGAVEELTDELLQQQLDTNLFGVLHVTQAALPILRAQGSGHIIQISTIGGIAAFPLLGGYHASKWALEGLTESLAHELSGTGIAVTLVEPGGYATDWAGSSAVWAPAQPQYDGIRSAMRERAGGPQGDPTGVGPALLKVVDAEKPPLRILFGSQPPQIVKHVYAERLATWAEWEPVSIEANGTGA